jgi:hypothetical protein
MNYVHNNNEEENEEEEEEEREHNVSIGQVPVMSPYNIGECLLYSSFSLVFIFVHFTDR